MKKLVLLFAALLVAGCGEKSSSEGSESLSDADVERLLKEAVEGDSIEERDGLYYQTNESEPHSGWTKKMYDSGQVQALARFKDGKMDGLVTLWHENGQKHFEGTYKDGNLISAKSWNSKGEEVEALEVSPSENPPPSAIDFDSLEERNGLFYQNNEPYSGWAKEMYDSGQVKGLGQAKDGKPDGLQTHWYENGLKESEVTYKDGKMDGLFRRWHENGQKQSEGTYKDGKKDGLWTSGQDNGQKLSEGTYKDGKRDGLFTYWRDNGRKYAEVTYKDGNLISAKSWNSKGEEVETEEETFR